MPLFSGRKGLKPVRTVVQKDGVDAVLRNGLWTALHENYWTKYPPFSYEVSANPDLYALVRQLWYAYFKLPIDNLPNLWRETLQRVRNYFFDCSWFEVYDFIEFVAYNYPDEYVNKLFMRFCNVILEREVSAYRFVSGQITEITSDQEIEAVEAAIAQAPKAASTHLGRALGLLSDRKFPDYRNSIKESISAVEALCRLIVGQPKATLGQAIGRVKDKVPIHPALEKAFDSLYGYTSNEQGIRHSLLEEPALDFEDAKFMLVSCAAFANYLLAKATKAGIKL